RGSIAFGVLVSEATAMKGAGADYGTAAGLPIGTGPYAYSSFKADKVELALNPKFQGTAPRIKKLTFAGFTTDTTAQLALRSGEVQPNYVNAPKSTPQWKSINGASVFSPPPLLSPYLPFDPSKAPFNDVPARLPIAPLVDRQSLARVAYGNEAQVMRGM